MKTLLILPFLIPFASAATLAVYEFGSGPDTAPITEDGISATTITYAAGLGTPRTSAATFAPSGPNALGFDPHVSDPGGTTPTNVADAISQNYHFTFTLTPAPGTSMSLTSFSLWGNYNNSASANNLALQIDTGSGFTTAGLITLDTQGAASPGNSHSILLSGYDNLDTAVTFRVIMYDTDGVRWSSYTRLDDIAIHGDVIPEPSLAAMLLIASSSLLIRRK